MRPLLLAATLSTAACSMNPQYSAPWTVRAVGRAYEARDACLAKQATLLVESGPDARSAGRAVSANCEAETSALIMQSNPHNDAAVSAAIRQDSDFRARRYVLRARGGNYEQQEIPQDRDDGRLPAAEGDGLQPVGGDYAIAVRYGEGMGVREPDDIWWWRDSARKTSRLREPAGWKVQQGFQPTPPTWHSHPNRATRSACC